MPFPRPEAVLVAGNISHDILVRPVEEFRWGASNWVEHFQEDMGGNGSNTAYAMARLGLSARLLGKVGADSRGDGILAKLNGAGVDARWVERAKDSTTTTVVIMNRAGDRQFIQYVGAAHEVFAKPFSFTGPVTEGITHYHQANIFALPNLRRHSGEQMRRAKAAGLATSIDTGWATDGKWVETLAPAFPYCDLLFTNEDEARATTGCDEPAAMMDGLRKLGARDIVLKLGARGCVVYEGGTSTHVPGFVVEAVDTTGAGDCFAGAFFAALHRGMNLVEAARMGNAMGAMVVSQVGATTGVTDWEQTVRAADQLPVGECHPK
ncbi:MAG: carbohydrate kinase family protein [Acidobacteriota bacterium]